jgi:hypothetical protein
MSSPVAVADSNQFDVLAQNDQSESKSWESSARSAKDDAKQQAYQARAGVKAKAANLKEQVVASSSGLVDSVSSKLNAGLEMAKTKVAGLTGDASIKEASNEELLDKAEGAATEGWQEVKRRGAKATKQGAELADAKINEKLTPEQRKQAKQAARSVKQAGVRAQRKVSGLFGQILSAPQLRGVRTFFERNPSLQMPAMVLGAILSIWLSLSLIRLITLATAPSTPEFDIHSPEATMNWLKWHAGDYKDRAIDTKDSLSGRAASFLANHKLEQLKGNADVWREIGMKKLGLSDPTWSEIALAWITGRPTTWQGRVESVLDLARKGIKVTALKKGLNAGMDGIKGSVRDTLGLNEPTMMERFANWITGRDTSLQGRMQAQASNIGSGVGGVFDSIRNTIPGMHKAAPVVPEGIVGSIKHKLVDGVDSIRSHLPGAAEAEAARARAYAATHASTLDNIKTSAEYLKNRVVHGAEEAQHIMEDRAKEAMDKAKYKTGL